MRIPDGLLIHRVIVEPRLEVPQPDGSEYGAPVERQAITVDGQKLVADARADSETRGTAILSNVHGLVQPEHAIPVGSRVTVWPGTPLERKVQVVAVAYGEHDAAPSSAQFWGA